MPIQDLTDHLDEDETLETLVSNKATIIVEAVVNGKQNKFIKKHFSAFCFQDSIGYGAVPLEIICLLQGRKFFQTFSYYVQHWSSIIVVFSCCPPLKNDTNKMQKFQHVKAKIFPKKIDTSLLTM